MTTAIVLLDLFQGYVMLGAVVAALFLSFGIDRIDPDARGSFVFRVVILPGVIGLWPLVLYRWWQRERGPAPWRVPHGRDDDAGGTR